ncbi:GET complex subunit GET1 NDAI_0D03630 [Naumovozyma dairenensis CBS 421]|uniref:Golgi to ER traffic protein 1 n=1 Tax=Naumovozyma dairenensis (strain ATCC 10597 / BCRC 20456 / CBS 421 / NBRC 0211 / NRRL Y-12639) TaxID=1071378 RepID=G0WA66_NAUDC|nr:hypothetical protein NDAI_0D03630 [Naumovozyma dairenensis CBS 421]CCD24677.1 hypothetical protein NDAI_0D03630 [Naumovozyma dairenensis CBS 421]
MSACNWVIATSLVFVTINKFLQYSTSYHASWMSKIIQHSVHKKSYDDYHKKLQERLELQEENTTISAQDNYAKWTKNNRKLEKLNEEIKALGIQLKSQQSSIEKQMKKFKLVTLTAPFIILKLWKGKFPVYYLPHSDMFPKIIGGVMSQGWLYLALLPLQILRGSSKVETQGEESMAIQVSVSLGIWLWALMTVISTVEFLINQLVFTKEVKKPVVIEEEKINIKAPNAIEEDKIALD